MKWVCAISDEPDLDAAFRDAADKLLGPLAGADPDLVLGFASIHHRGSYAKLVELVGKEFPRSLLLGCSARSVIGADRELEEQPGLSLAAAILPGVELHPFHLAPDALPAPGAGPEAWHELIGVSSVDTPHFVLLADPFTGDAERAVAGLDASFPSSVKVGGLASGGDSPGENALYLGHAVQRSGIVGVALRGNIELDTVVAQGCRPVGDPMFVTRCRENVLLEVDGGRPVALVEEIYAQASPEDQELFRTSLFLGIEMREGEGEYHPGDFLIRNLIGADNGALIVGALLHEGQVVQLHLRDAETSAADLERLLARYCREVSDGPSAAGALLFSCLGRGMHLYGQRDHDTHAFHRHLGDVPLAGFFCNGEIGPVRGQTFLHGYTSAFGIFRPRGVAA